MKKISFSILILWLSIFSADSQTLFRWPVQAVNEYSEVNEFYVTNNYVDDDTLTLAVRDWVCRSRSYNGHKGVDIDIWPFTWDMMYKNYVTVVAAAPGRVAMVNVNHSNENNCGAPPTGNLNWNVITIRHDDSSTTMYGHLRDNSAMVSEGDRVSAGQVLAFVGSSGNSSNPHLHFEVHNSNSDSSITTTLIDPYVGPTCNLLNAVSWWQSQKPYLEPAIVRVMSHGSRPSLLGYANNYNPGYCASAEVKNAKASFAPNDSIYIGVGMRDFLQSLNHSFNIKVYYPDGSTWIDENKSSNLDSTFRRVYYTFDKKIPGNAPSGTYKVLVSFNSASGVFFFTVNCPTNQNVTGTYPGSNGFKSSDVLTSTALIPSGSRMLLQANNKITLSPGFSAQNGSRLKARIRDCNYVE